MSHVVHATMDSPIGRLRLSASPQGLRSIDFAAGDAAKAPVDATLRRAITQLREYFAGQRRAFDLALDPQGTEFQRQVWQALVAIPYGETTSYGELARRIGRPAAVRAVGAATAATRCPSSSHATASSAVTARSPATPAASRSSARCWISNGAACTPSSRSAEHRPRQRKMSLTATTVSGNATRRIDSPGRKGVMRA